MISKNQKTKKRKIITYITPQLNIDKSGRLLQTSKFPKVTTGVLCKLEKDLTFKISTFDSECRIARKLFSAHNLFFLQFYLNI